MSMILGDTFQLNGVAVVPVTCAQCSHHQLDFSSQEQKWTWWVDGSEGVWQSSGISCRTSAALGALSSEPINCQPETLNPKPYTLHPKP